jgi:hypothetical protein
MPLRLGWSALAMLGLAALAIGCLVARKTRHHRPRTVRPGEQEVEGFDEAGKTRNRSRRMLPSTPHLRDQLLRNDQDTPSDQMQTLIIHMQNCNFCREIYADVAPERLCASLLAEPGEDAVPSDRIEALLEHVRAAVSKKEEDRAAGRTPADGL